MLPSGIAGALAPLFGAPYDPNRGLIASNFYRMTNNVFPQDNDDLAAGITGVAGATLQITNLDGSAPTGSSGPLYFAASGLPDATLPATTDSGYGAGANYIPDLYLANPVPPPGLQCNTRWLPKHEGKVLVKVRAHSFTGMWDRCIQP
jgi:hypothetical protein